MLLTITTTYQPATDLGYLLHKHPAKVQTFSLSSYGKAHVFYPMATDTKCTAALLLEIDPITLARGTTRGSNSFPLQPYVNDRPYVASSFMSRAIVSVFGSALNGNCADKPDLVKQALPLTIEIAAMPIKGGEKALRQLFEPLGYQIEVQDYLLDEQFPQWGRSRYYTVKLQHHIPLKNFLRHLYLLIPVLDGEKHYWVGAHEMEKLLEKGEGWLANHPHKELITNRYLKYLSAYSKKALSQLNAQQKEVVPTTDDDEIEMKHEANITDVKGVRLNVQRINAVVEQLQKSGASTILDLGCGSGVLVRRLMKFRQFKRILGMDVSYQTLVIAKERIKYNNLPPHLKDRVQFIQGSLMYKDDRLENFDAAALVEVIEHIEPSRLSVVERIIFECAKPKTVIITTPNRAYNVKFETLPVGKMRHNDHRFEWTRQEFQQWATKVCEKFNYQVTFHNIGPVDEKVGSPTQMGVFHR